MSAQRLEFAGEAVADLDAIAQYTEATWGADQADKYSAEIWGAFKRLQAFPHSGRARPDIGTGMRSVVAEQHLVVYTILDQTIRILRVVHARSQIGKHLIAGEEPHGV